MDWFSIPDGGAALHFGWAVGSASGLYAAIIITVLIMTAPPYHPDLPRAARSAWRKNGQRVFSAMSVVLLAAWGFCGYHASGDLAEFAVALSFGMLSVIGPLMLILMFTAANWVGEASAR